MAAATINTSFIAPIGPIKMEVAYLTSVTDEETYTTKIQRPLFAFGVVNSDGSPMTAAIDPTFTAGEREITLNSGDLDGDDDLVLVIFGF